MKKKNTIILITVFLLISGCVDHNDEIKLQLSQNLDTSTNEKLNFKLFFLTDNDSKLSFSIHENLHDTIMMNSIKNLNLCKSLPFYVGKRKSNVKEIYISKDSPYILNISADYRFDEANGLYVYDFGELGKICTNQHDKKFVLAFTFWEASTYKNLFVYRSNGVTSNRINVQTIDFK